MDEEGHKIYRCYEEEALKALAEGWLELKGTEIRQQLEGILRKQGWKEFKKRVSEMFVEFARLVQQIEKDLGNKRKALAGTNFERAVEQLLRFVGVEIERPKGEVRKLLRRIDLVVPNQDVAIKEPDRAVFLTLKRTLRERWKQEIPVRRGQGKFYLVTIDPSIPEPKAEEIREMEVIAYVQDSIAHQLKKEWIRPLSKLPSDLGVD